MKIILDTNILLSALIKDSITRKIIFMSDWSFYYPEMSFGEVIRHKELVLKKSGMNEGEYDALLNHLLEHINLIPEANIAENLKKARKAMKHIDPDDVVFLAATLSVHNSLLWSDDSDFDRQKEVKVYKTKDIVKIFEILS